MRRRHRSIGPAFSAGQGDGDDALYAGDDADGGSVRRATDGRPLLAGHDPRLGRQRPSHGPIVMTKGVAVPGGRGVAVTAVACATMPFTSPWGCCCVAGAAMVDGGGSASVGRGATAGCRVGTDGRDARVARPPVMATPSSPRSTTSPSTATSGRAGQGWPNRHHAGTCESARSGADGAGSIWPCPAIGASPSSVVVRSCVTDALLST